MTTDISYLRNHLALTVVNDALERKRPNLKEDQQFPYRTRDLRAILFDNLKCLESRLKTSRLKEGSYHFPKKNITEVLEAVGYYTPNNASERDLERMIGGLTELVKDVYALEKNPENFKKLREYVGQKS